MKNTTRVTGASQSWLKLIQNHLFPFCVILSLVVHLLAVITFLALRKPVIGQVEEGFTVTFSTIKRPVLKRESISHKPTVPIRPLKALADVESQKERPQFHQDSEQPAIRSTPLPLQSSPDNSPLMTNMEDTEGFAGRGSNAAEGRLGGVPSTVPFVSGESVVNPKNALSNPTGALQSPIDKEKPTRAIALADSIDSDRIQPPTLERNRSNQVDVVFVISCRETNAPLHQRCCCIRPA